MPHVRLLTAFAFSFLSVGVGAAGTAYWYEQKILRAAEEREGYRALADTAIATSSRALSFALGYQQVLDTCMAQLYRPSLEVSGVVVKSRSNKGGVGGPNATRGNSKLP